MRCCCCMHTLQTLAEMLQDLLLLRCAAGGAGGCMKMRHYALLCGLAGQGRRQPVHCSSRVVHMLAQG